MPTSKQKIISAMFSFQVRRYRSEVSSLQTSLNKARVERMSSSLGAGASSGARQTSSAGGGGGAVTDQYRQQVMIRMIILNYNWLCPSVCLSVCHIIILVG